MHETIAPDAVSRDRSKGGSPAQVLKRMVLRPWRALFGLGYVVTAIVAGMGVWLVASAPVGGAVSPTSRVAFVVLLVNLIAILALAGLVGLRVLKLARERDSDAGARLHLRFVTLFSLVAVVPAVLVALVFGVLVNRGVEGWFSERVQASVEGGADLGRIYIQDQGERMTADLNIVTGELGGIRTDFQNPVAFGGALSRMAQFFDFGAIYILNADGEVVAEGAGAEPPPYLAPTEDALTQARAVGDALAQGAPATGAGWPIAVTENPDTVRVLATLPGYDGAYLYLARSLGDGMVQRLTRATDAVAAYREAEQNRARVQAAFFLSYLEVALLMLIGAVQLGMSAANAISAPVSRLVHAAGRVSSGDLDARVDSDLDPAEIRVLSVAFNRMTSDLQAQQAALRAAGTEARDRSRFIETVLSGVSAGVVGLDSRGRISAYNAQALKLLGLEGDPTGKGLAKAAPELKPIVSGGAGAELDIDVSRGAETRRLRVRVAGAMGGERVLTFDDITRLVSAQRNAAWRDVARRIAHEIKNPLTPIQLSAERLRRKYRGQVSNDVETFDRCTDTIIRQVGDIGRMVDEFSSFARMPTPKFAKEDAVELLRQAVFAQRVAVAETPIELVEPLPDAPLVCDARMVGQALTNLLKNAGEAVTARTPEPGFTPRLRAEILLDDDSLTFVVEDDGVGLPKRDRDRLTEPYVTTREKGTGL
ncbi:MAG TPA: histidine kinase dimerization/phospho-acceptor domain-containing protein, partial [Caulobacteraceae bacterium]